MSFLQQGVQESRVVVMRMRQEYVLQFLKCCKSLKPLQKCSLPAGIPGIDGDIADRRLQQVVFDDIAPRCCGYGCSFPNLPTALKHGTTFFLQSARSPRAH